ncbi:universal stress protein [Anaerosphaera multitolerans]|uniref:Universal stress protein n=1 Tax=Anaerosphaera multitolerans TaxID=2487351 RepID=A0A437S493_9FIRM|nr:universal stress protein [Anaerosphaera multitolerans]RVU53808.1 universal stress protein [Anaerosphaera multitolerans]
MKILVPVDCSKMTKAIVDNAKDIGEKFEAELILMTVVDEIGYKDRHSYPIAIDAEVKEMEKEMEELKEENSDYKYGLKTILKVGSPYREIVKAADDEDVDFIVMGNRGRGVFSRTLLGSVSNKVLNHSDKSVLIVKTEIEED